MRKFAALLATAILGALPMSLPAAEPFEVTPLPFGRNMHGATAARDYLFVIGGDTPSGFTPSVQMARLNADRTIGAWIESKPLPVKLIYISNSTISDNNVIYVAGGQIVEDTDNPANYSKQDNNKVYFSRVGPDGLLTDWRATAPWPTKQCLGSTALVAAGRFYLIGGGETESQQPRAEVFSATINQTDGSLGPWQSTTPLPVPLWFHSSFLVDDHIYATGGRKGVGAEDIVGSVYSAKVNADGTLGDWLLQLVGLPRPVNSAAACATDRFAFLFCGMTIDGSLLNVIQMSGWNDSGPAEWSATPTDISARYYSSATVSPSNRAIYIVAGRRSTFYQDMITNVYCYPLRENAVTDQKTADTKQQESFLSFEEAAAIAGNESRPLLIFFYSQKSMSSEALLRTLSGSTGFFREIGNMVPAAVDVSKKPELARKYSVMRLPTVMVVDPQGKVLGQTSGLLSQQEIVQFLQQTTNGGG